jgi:hypothetical protein
MQGRTSVQDLQHDARLPENDDFRYRLSPSYTLTHSHPTKGVSSQHVQAHYWIPTFNVHI